MAKGKKDRRKKQPRAPQQETAAAASEPIASTSATGPEASVAATADPKASIAPTTGPEVSVAATADPKASIAAPTGPQTSVAATADPKASIAAPTGPQTSVAATADPKASIAPTTGPQTSVAPTASLPLEAPVKQLQQLKLEPSKSTTSAKKEKTKEEKEIAGSFKQESSKLPFVKRPDYGNLGIKVKLIVNYYKILLKQLRVYHYDVVVESIIAEKSGKGDAAETSKSRQVSARNLNHLVVKQMCDTYSGVKDVFHGKFPVFDGQKSLYSAKELTLPKDGRFLVKLNEGGRESEFAVNLKYARFVDYNPVRQTVPSEDITQVLEIMLTYGPRFAKQNPKLVIRSSLYNVNAQADDLGENKILRFGCYGNVKQTKSGLMFNLDRKAAVFHKGGMLINVFDQLGVTLRPPYTLSKRERDLIDGQLKHLKIAVIHMTYERKYTYQKLTEKSVASIEFLADGKKINVKSYFEQTYKDSLRAKRIVLNGNFPCVNVGKDKYLPLEVCKLLPNQQFSGKLPENILSQMTRQASQMKPPERFAVINQYRNEIVADGRDFMAQMGLSIDLQMTTVDGRILPMPKLVNKDANRRTPTAFMPQKFGSWKMSGPRDPPKHFFHTVPCSSWLLFNFAHRNVTRDSAVSAEQIEEFVKNFRKVAAEYGMQFAMPKERPPLLNPDEFRTNIGDRLFKKALEKYGDLQLILFVIPKLKGLYEEIKHAGDVIFGVPTQCVSSVHFARQRRRGRDLPPLAFNDDYLGNLLQKMNSRLGGINVVLDPGAKPEYLRKKTMIVGIDASHPSPNDKVSRSVAACVASFDPHHSKFIANIMVQEPFKKVQHLNEEKEKLVEEIVKLDQMMIALLTKYREVNKILPENIIIFRDGVSDGQFKIVFEHEIQALKNSFLKFGPYNPKLTLIIVQKRHHTRFMPTHTEMRSGNVMPGTCVDDTITSPVLWDYFLCSHEGPLGTSRPARYSVLWDDYGFNSNNLQLITFHCCFLYGRCLKPVSIPAPVYYAHLASKRARDHLKVICDEQPSLVDMQHAVDTQKSIARNVTYFV